MSWWEGVLVVLAIVGLLSTAAIGLLLLWLLGNRW